MTSDERLTIALYLDRIKQQCADLMRNIDKFQDMLGEIEYSDMTELYSAKEKFLIDH